MLAPTPPAPSLRKTPTHTHTHIRDAVARRAVRPVDVDHLEAGAPVGLYRAQGQAGRRRKAGDPAVSQRRGSMRPGYLIGTFLTRKSVFKLHDARIRYGGRVYEVSARSIRPAIGYENSFPDQESVD